jgi:V/A-type H+-transporting ATPase subunit F
MKIFLVSDNVDTAMGFRLAGVDGVVVHSEEEVVETISNLLSDKNVALIMIAENLVELCREWIYEVKSSAHTPIVQIPDRHGSKKSASVIIGEYLKSALGVSL